MKQAFGLVRRSWGVFYLKHKITGEQKSLKTSDIQEQMRGKVRIKSAVTI